MRSSIEYFDSTSEIINFPIGNIQYAERIFTPCTRPSLDLKDLKINEEIKNELMILMKKSQDNISEGLIHGNENDRRKAVNTSKKPDRNKDFPFSAICSIDTCFSEKTFSVGTGFMIGSRYILTASHTVYLHDHDAKIYISPGRKDDEVPFGVHRVSHVYLFTRKIQGNFEDDLALLAIEEEIGYYTGWFGMMDMPYLDLKKIEEKIVEKEIYFDFNKLNVTGYDPPEISTNFTIEQTLKTHSGDLIEKSKLTKNSDKDDILAYDIDTVAGQSGSPVWITQGNNSYAVGVHNTHLKSEKINIGARLDAHKIKKIVQIINNKSDNYEEKILLNENLNCTEHIEELENIKYLENLEDKNEIEDKIEERKILILQPEKNHPKNLEEVLDFISNLNEEDKSKIIEILTKSKKKSSLEKTHETDEAYSKTDSAEEAHILESTIKVLNQSLYEVNMEPWEVKIHLFEPNSDDIKKLELNEQNFDEILKLSRSFGKLKNFDTISFDFKGVQDLIIVKKILKLVPASLKCDHIDIKLDLCEEILQKFDKVIQAIPKSDNLDILFRQKTSDFKDHIYGVIEKFSHICETKKIYIEFEFEKTDEVKIFKEKDHEIENFKLLDLVYLRSGFCVLIRNPAHIFDIHSLDYLSLRKDYIKCICLSFSPKQYKDKECLGKILNLLQNKQILYFENLSSFDKDFKESVFNKIPFTNIRKLFIEFLDDKTKDFNFFPFQLFQNLKSLELKFKNYFSADDEFLEKISKSIAKLRLISHLDLDFSLCSLITKNGVQELSETLKTLETLTKITLNFSSCTGILEEGFISLSRSFQKLKKLHHFQLISDSTLVNNDCLKELSLALQFLSELKWLILTFNFCSLISDEGIKELSKYLEEMKQLKMLTCEFRNCFLIGDVGLSEFSNCLKNLNHLISLNLTFDSCHNISDNSLAGMFSLTNGPNMSKMTLSFDNCSCINDLSSLSSNLSQWKKISKLKISYSDCINISCTQFCNLFKSLKSLTLLKMLILNFSGCDQIKDFGINALSESLAKFRELEFLQLNFERVNSITNRGIRELVSSLKYLTNLEYLNMNFRDCHRISDPGFKEFSTFLHTSKVKVLFLNFLDCPLTEFCMSNYFSKSLESLPLKGLDLKLPPKVSINRQFFSNLSKAINKADSLVYYHLKLATKVNHSLMRIDESLSCLKNLKSLNLDLTNFMDLDETGIYEITKSLEETTELLELSLVLQAIIFNDKSIKYISNSLKKLWKLNQLHLLVKNSRKDQNRFSRANLGTSNIGLIELGSALQVATYLTVLKIDMPCCFQITDEGVKEFSHSIKSLIHLKNLHLNFGITKFEGPGVIYLSQSIQNFSSITELFLNLVGCKVGQDEINSLSVALKSLICLRSLSLNLIKCPNFEDKSLQSLSESIQNLKSLSNLTLSFYASSLKPDKGFQNLCLSLGKLSICTNLNLNLKSCGVNEGSLRLLFNNLNCLKSLTSLTLLFDSVSIGNTSLEFLSVSIVSFYFLTHLKLEFEDCTAISNHGFRLLFESLIKLENLRVLDMSFDRCKKINDKSIKTIEENIEKFSNLVELVISFNYCDKITDEALKKMEELISNFSWMKKFILYNF